jgi:Flp pilus assembly pilin Flp
MANVLLSVLLRARSSVEGQNLVEYALIMLIIALSSTIAIMGVSGSVQGFWNFISTAIPVLP